MSDHADAVVVGAGPNGLTAAVVLARAGLQVTVLEAADEVGGGTRSAELTVPGLVHDVCSAVHPLGAASPVFRRLDLTSHGLEWRHAPVALAHPLDDGTAAVVHRSLDATEAALGADGRRWRRLVGVLAADWDRLAHDALRPLLRAPRHPLILARFGAVAVAPATVVARRFATPAAQALFTGIAAHASVRLDRPLTSATGLVLGAAAHVGGWPVAAGGSAAIARALLALLERHGGTVQTGVRVRRWSDVPAARLRLLDLTPTQVLELAGDRLPPGVRRSYARWRYGPAAFKLDLAVAGGIPWTAEACRDAGTVHVGGTLAEIAAAERAAVEGRVPERPFVLVGQQYLADPARSQGDVHPVWAYSHVPAGYAGDASQAIEAQIERFAPGFRDRVIARHVWRPADLESYNASYRAGDIAGGSHGGMQLVARPRLHPVPYATGIPGVFLCSASTPPGAGVHGMCGSNAAAAALRWLRG